MPPGYNGRMDDEANAVFNGDERRQQIYSALLQHNSVVAGLYRAAIRSFKTPAYPGEERARIALIFHSMREIMNTLASVMGDSSQGTRQDDAEKLVRQLPEKLSEYPDLDLRQDNEYIAVPREVAVFMWDLATLASREEGNIREDIASLLAPGSGKNHPVVKEWKGARDFFVKHAHLKKPPEDVNISDDEIERTIRLVEDLMEVRLREFFESRHEIDSLLDDINESRED